MALEFFKKKQPEKGGITSERSLRTEKVTDDMFPRFAYEVGALKLDVKFKFSTGETLSAVEDEKGIASIVLKRGDNELENFNELLPGYVFVTPTYEKKNPAFFDEIGHWGCHPGRFIEMGDMREPKDIMILLHEIGHAIDFKTRNAAPFEGYVQQQKLHNASIDKKGAAIRTYAQYFSERERAAWSQGLRLARRIRDKHDVNLLEGFKNAEELRDFSLCALLTHRESLEEDVAPHAFMAYFWEQHSRLWGKETNSDLSALLETLFDKGRAK